MDDGPHFTNHQLTVGGLCSKSSSPPAPYGLVYSASVRVAADADTMWSIVSDLQASADAVQAVQSLAYGNNVDKQQQQQNSDNTTTKFSVETIVEKTRVYQGQGLGLSTTNCRDCRHQQQHAATTTTNSRAEAGGADKANIDEGQTQQQQRLTTDSIGHVQQRLHG
jgi:hypothetical protein